MNLKQSNSYFKSQIDNQSNMTVDTNSQSNMTVNTNNQSNMTVNNLKIDFVF